MTTSGDRALLTVEDTCSRLGIGVSTLRRWRRAGLVRVVQLGTRPRVPATEVERLVRDGLPIGPPIDERRRVTGGVEGGVDGTDDSTRQR